MKASSFILMTGLLLVVLFAGLNTEAFSTPSELSLLFGSVTAPIGLVMLGVLGTFTLTFLLLLSRSRAASLLESHRSGKELEKARKVADNAEETRIRALEKLIRSEFAMVEEKFDALLASGENENIAELVRAEGDEMVERIDQAQDDLAKRIEDKKRKSG